ncbi:MAG TPA: LPXTG cell wall anchor domain-containing protein [Bryobacteraceae bacterium]|nr:LPXTG cell wall anchor domain-containing protein [Bryobacteraceae bacterium]
MAFKQVVSTLAVSVVLLCQPALRADEWNKKTVVTVDQEIQLPNVVLQPGTYVFRLLDSQSDRHIVQILNKDENQVITTLLAIPNYRLQPRGKTVFAFWEVPAGQVPAVRAWFYPGDLFGQEFTYPKDRAMQVAAYTKTAVPTSNAQSTEEMKSTAIASVNQNGQTAELDKNAYTAPVPAPAPVTAQAAEPPQVAQAAEPPQVAPAPAPETRAMPEAPAELPHTASGMPAAGLGGLILLIGSLALGRSRRSAMRS